MNNDLISREALIKAIEQGEGISWERHKKDDLCVRKKYIDNAPTVEAYTEDDVKNAIKEGHEVGYEMAKAKYERPTEVNCSHCDYFTFSKRFIENIVGVMLKYKIETVDDLMTELNRINELMRVKDELNDELNELKEGENE